ncbi:MAG TPA: hypothetical protein VGL56_06930 [Fimbriimonadaceae bacterium]|jgi:hypothetical protein
MNEPIQRKNLHASIPPALLLEAEKTAAAEHISVDDLVREAMERRLQDSRREKLYAYGQERAGKLGIGEKDVDGMIQQHRQDKKELGRYYGKKTSIPKDAEL